PPRSRRNSGRIGSTEPTPVPTRKTAAMVPQSAVRRARLVEAISTGLDLHQPFGIEQPSHPYERSHRPDGAEDFAVRLPDLAPAARHGGEDSRPRDVVKAGAHSGKRLADHPKTLARLFVDVGPTDDRSVRRRRRTATNFDGRPDSNGPRVSQDGLPLATGGHDLALHAAHATSPPLQLRRRPLRARAVRSRPARPSAAPSIARRPGSARSAPCRTERRVSIETAPPAGARLHSIR